MQGFEDQVRLRKAKTRRPQQIKTRPLASLENTPRVQYMVANTVSSYNVITGRPALNAIEAAVSYAYLCIKYAVDGQIETIREDQEATKICYEMSLQREQEQGTWRATHQCNFLDLDPRYFKTKWEEKRSQPVEEVNEVIIGGTSCQKMEIGTDLLKEVETASIKFPRDTNDVFAWQLENIKGIDLTLYATDWQQPLTTDMWPTETSKLYKSKFIQEVKYPTWLVNPLLVKMANR